MFYLLAHCTLNVPRMAFPLRALENRRWLRSSRGPESPLSRLSSHSYERSSMASIAETPSTITGGGSTIEGRHVFNTGSTSQGGTGTGTGYTGSRATSATESQGGSVSYTSSTSDTSIPQQGGRGGASAGADSGGSGGGGGRGAGGLVHGGPSASFSSSYYREVYGDESSVASSISAPRESLAKNP